MFCKQSQHRGYVSSFHSRLVSCLTIFLCNRLCCCIILKLSAFYVSFDLINLLCSVVQGDIFGFCPTPIFARLRTSPVAPPVVLSPPRQDELMADPMDSAITSAINSLLQGNISASPMSTSLPMYSTALGAILSDRIEGKIWADEYVNIYELTNPLQPQPQQLSVASGSQIFTLMPQPSMGRQISTIDQWMFAFLVFWANYSQCFPNSAPGMFKGNVQIL